jgi:hypothetical protein
VNIRFGVLENTFDILARKNCKGGSKEEVKEEARRSNECRAKEKVASVEQIWRKKKEQASRIYNESRRNEC